MAPESKNLILKKLVKKRLGQWESLEKVTDLL